MATQREIMQASLSLPIAILSFDRPEYLAKTLSSLQAQTKPLGDRQITLFQDGSWSPSMNKHHCDPALCRQCVSIFRDQFPSGTVFESDINLGSVFNYERAERYVFETLNASAAIFLEDDLILGRAYITVLERLIDLALEDERIGYVAAFGNWKATREQQLRNTRKLRPMHLLWAFGLTQRHWRKCRPYVEQYLDLVRGSDYRQRDHQKIKDLVQSWGIEPGDTGQDRIKAFATASAGCVMVNTEVAYGRYIGQKGGLNFTPALYKQWGLEKTEYLDEEASLDFDLSTVNFDPWSPGNNVRKTPNAASSRPYDGAFFEAQSDGSKRSAEIVVPIVIGAVRPKSVVDVGCGVGAWLREFERAGITDYLGIDGQYVPLEQLLIPRQRFCALDLVTNRLSLERTYDLAISLEVAEHLPATQAESFICSLVELALAILFSAAVPFQGGTGHINEQWQEYWRGLFQKFDFTSVDFVRPRIWGNPKVAWWYQQNMVLYVKCSALPEYPSLEFHADSKTLNIVHPALLEINARKTWKSPPVQKQSEQDTHTGDDRDIGSLTTSLSPIPTEDDVVWCYRHILERKPESRTAIERHLLLKDFRELVLSFIHSGEFQRKKGVPPFVPLDRHAVEVEVFASPPELTQLHERTREAWTHLGTVRPYHSVLTGPEFLPKNLNDEAVQRFWASGTQESGTIRAILKNHGFYRYTVEELRGIRLRPRALDPSSGIDVSQGGCI
jgi:hypothetical protein